jgi:hypothetical protein
LNLLKKKLQGELDELAAANEHLKKGRSEAENNAKRLQQANKVIAV